MLLCNAVERGGESDEEMWKDELYIHTPCLSAVDEHFTNISRSLEFIVPFPFGVLSLFGE